MISLPDLATIGDMRVLQKTLCVIAVAVISSCAAQPTSISVTPSICDETKSLQKGKREAEAGQLPSLAAFKSCPAKEREAYHRAYRKGYESVKGNKEDTAAEKISLDAASSWVCEIEANSKVFTGVGFSQEEAMQSAKKTCGAHMQSSSCGSTECRTSL